MNIEDLCDNARYSEQLQALLDSLGAAEVLKLSYESDYQGFVDCDVLLSDGRVFSYEYFYGSCSGCDDWENRDLTDEQIIAEMRQEATYYDDMEQYKKALAVRGSDGK